ncbi:MAG: ROK family protein [Actinomycetales bacterium]|nr:ROK family protein [Actinomycetales bacterium]
MSTEAQAPGGALPGEARDAADVLAVMLDGRPRTRAELGVLTGLGRGSVGSKVEALLGSGLLAPVGAAVSTGGRPPVQFRFDPGSRVVIAADLGASHGVVALTDLEGSTIDSFSAEISIADGPDEVLGWVSARADELLERHGRRDDLVGVGVGVPGPVEHSSGRPVRPPIMPGWDGFDIPARLSSEFHVPVLVDNDVNLMALGEHAAAHPQIDDLLFVKVATGIGAGIITHGRLHRGAKGSAGDLGHVASRHGGGVQCRCGNIDCLEAVAAGPALAARLRAKGIQVERTVDILHLVEAGSMEAAAELREAGRIIGEALATCVSLLNPSVIVLGGLLTRAGDHLIAGVREVVYTRSLPLATGSLQILPAETGRDAAIVGAAVMVTEHSLGVRKAAATAS